MFKNIIEKNTNDNKTLLNNFNNLQKEISDLKYKNQLNNNELEKLKNYKNDFEKLRFDYETLLKQLQTSEEIREQQKILIKKMQFDLDEVRRENYNRIEEIRQNSLLLTENEQKNLNDNLPLKEIKRKNKSKSKGKKILNKK